MITSYLAHIVILFLWITDRGRFKHAAEYVYVWLESLSMDATINDLKSI